MGCRWCVHWVSEDGRYEKDCGQNGECRRFPTPVATVSEYRCGEFMCEPDCYPSSPRGSNLMQGFFERMHENHKDAQAERTKRIALEKANKELRKKLRHNVELRGAPPLFAQVALE